MRCFFAIKPPEELCESLKGVCSGMREVREIDPEMIHLTLRFLGDLGTESMEDLLDAASSFLFEPFEIEIEGVGFFPYRAPKLRYRKAHLSPARVLFAGVADSKPLFDLKFRLDKALTDFLRLAPDDRNYAPHLTLGRAKDLPEARLINWLKTHHELKREKFLVDTFGLYSSSLESDGARYQLLEEVKLCPF